jgi:phospholipid/cholesterol/gamma-HCH transport system substrate-binding protein
MTEKVKTILIGSFIIISCLAFIGVLLFLRPSVGDGKKTLFVCFTSIEKIQIGTRVTFAGKPIGEVVAIDPIYDARNQPVGRSGHVCFYELELKVDSHTVIYDTDEITIHTTGLLGERTIAIVPKAVKKGQPSYPVTDQILYGKSGDPVEETLNQIISIGNKAGEAIDQLKDILQSNKSEIPLTLKAIKDASTQIKTTFEAINTTHSVAKLNDMVCHIDDASKKLDKILTQWDQNGIGESAPRFAKNIADFSEAINDKETIRSLLKNLNATAYNFKNFSDSMSPTGTIAKLFKGDDIYMQLSSCMTKANLLFSDINDYGILFHNNKSWQRERAKRMNILNTICCPQDFRAYFDEEMNKISLSICRITQSLHQAQLRKDRCSVLKDPCFKDGYKEMLQRISNMEEMLQVYEQQLMDRCFPISCTKECH